MSKAVQTPISDKAFCLQIRIGGTSKIKGTKKTVQALKPLQKEQQVRKQKMFFIFITIVGMITLLSGCSQKEEPKLNRYDAQFFELFDTVTSIVGYTEDEETFREYANELRDELLVYHQLYDIYHDYEGMANLKTINDNAGIQPVKVDEKIIAMLEEAIEMYEKTDGRMNIAMGSVLSLWHDYREAGSLDADHAAIPSDEELQEAAKHMDIYKIKIDREASTVFLEDPDMSLDVGSVGKGYATEMVCQNLEKKGLTSGLISVGGNVRGIGTKPGGEKWKVGVQNPDLTGDRSYLHTLEIEDMSLVTSGVYQRFYTVDKKQYHHIIHPDLLMPWDAYASVSIVCQDSGLADCLSTAVFNMEAQEGLAFIEGLDNVEALWIYQDGSEMCSSGFKEYVKDEDGQ